MKKIIIYAILVLSVSAQAFNMATYNIRNFNPNSGSKGTDLNLLESTIKEVNPDIMSVEEIKNKDAFNTFIKYRFPNYKIVLSECGGGGSQHLGFVINSNIFEITGFDEDLRFTDVDAMSVGTCGSLRPAVVVSLKNKKTGLHYLAISLHLKASGSPSATARRIKQYAMVSDLVNYYRSQKKYSNIAVFGDLNTVGLMTGHQQEIEAFNRMLTTGGLVNMTQNIKCSAYWSGGTNDGIEDPSKLDHIFISREFKGVSNYPTVSVHSHCAVFSCKNFKVTPDMSYRTDPTASYKYVSDHCPVRLSL